MVKIILLSGFMIYWIYEGVTEAYKWNNIDFRKLSDEYIGKYHLFRSKETIGINVILFACTLMMDTAWFQKLALMASFNFIGFPVYRAAFVIARKGQNLADLSPPWKWKLYNPFTRKVGEWRYPPAAAIVLIGIAGFILLFI